MSLTWRGGSDLRLPPMTLRGALRAAGRGVPVVALIGLGLLALLAARVMERPLFGPRRPWTPWITVVVCRGALRFLGLRLRRTGRPMRGPGAVVANHASWLDILVLNALGPFVFVAKSEVRGWGALGWLARATGTVFVRREARAEAGAQAEALAQVMRSGGRVAFFPEGTSTDNRRVLPFRAPLFAALGAPGLAAGVAVQPVTLRYDAPLLAWYGGTELLPHLRRVLSDGGIDVHVVFGAARKLAAGDNRKVVTQESGRLVRRLVAALNAGRSPAEVLAESAGP